ncbi:ATP-binding protein [uncultured Desulfuromonas sp.]|uniref:ATP-binding response regulator n=1 Tax=uncultured Desulfuromonas sp. TaxID=181013 RepID=UPI00260DEE9A|nr:ATP-binding protein [uncultured Desulfuromonas sp.]
MDDDSSMRLVMAAALEKAGFRVCEADNGRVALAVVEERCPDLVVLDVVMPELDGFATCRALRERYSGEHLPILMVTGLDDIDAIHQAFEVGATDFIAKPINWTVLGYRVRYLLRASAMTRELEKSEANLKIALAEAEAARDRIDGILKSVVDGLVVTDARYRIVLMNRAAEDLLGVRLSDVIDCSVNDAIRIDALRDQLLGKRKERGGKTDLEFQLRLPGRDKEQFIQARSGDVLNCEGGHRGTITILRDITREREVDQLKSEFISTAAHELTTPLTSVLGFTELLLEGGDLAPQEQKDHLGCIYEKAEKLSRIVDDLLDLSRIESGQLILLQKTRFDSRELIRNVIEPLRQQHPRWEWVSILPDASLPLHADHAKIGQVLENLIGNAIKYSPGGGAIKVQADATEDRVQVAVQDEGLGMSADQAARIFEKFYRADASNTAVEGLGLGMTIAKNIVEAHDGKIWVESEPGRGTTVTFTLHRG